MFALNEDFFNGDGQAGVSPPTGRLHIGTLSPYQQAQQVSGQILSGANEAIPSILPITALDAATLPIVYPILSPSQIMIGAALAMDDKTQIGLTLSKPIADRSELMVAGLHTLDSPWGTAKPVELNLSAPLHEALPLLSARRAKETPAIPISHPYRSPLRSLVKVKTVITSRYQKAIYPPWVFRSGGGGGGGNPDNPGNPDPHGTWIIVIRSSYMAVPDVEILRLPERIRIPASDIYVDHNADKKDWDFNAQILGPDALEAVLPSETGEPVTLEVSINGYAWQVLVEDWGADLSARAITRTISGRSLSAKLGEPFVLPIDYLSTELFTAQQLVAATLPYGWQLDWQAVDWPVTAGAWSATQKTPIQVAKAFADVIGAVVIPDRTTQKLTVQPRYPVPPWDFATATPDINLPGSITTVVSMGYAIPAQANAVFIHGGLTGGVLAKVYREGTAGELLLQTVQDDLITHIDAARARGTRLLAGQWQQPVIKSFALPIKYGTYPLVKLGDLLQIEINRVSINTRGIANAVTIAAVTQNKKLKVRQTVTIGERTPNLWANWSLNLPKFPKLPGVVESINGDGRATVLLVGGGSIRVSGSAVASVAEGDPVFVQNGELKGQAPTFTSAAMIAV